MTRKRRKRNNCPNCGHKIVGAENYCSNCGQENHDINVPASYLVMEMIESVLHFDTKVFRTARDMFMHPGRITACYNQGKRTEYVPPARLYIFISILYFFIAGLAINIDDSQGIVLNVTGRDSTGNKVQGTTLANSFTNEELQFISKASPASIDSIINLKKLAPGFMNRLAVKHAAMAETDPRYSVHMMEKILKSISFSLFLLMPIFALILKIIFWKGQMLYVQHLIFSIHSHTMFFFILLLSQLTYIITGYSVLIWTLAAALLYLLFSMKNVYGKKWGGTVFRFLSLLFFYFIATAAAIAVSLLTGAMML